MVPWRGYRPKIRAAFVEVRATNWLGDSRPVPTPLVHRIGMRSPTPGTPFGIRVKSERPNSLPGIAAGFPSYEIGRLPSKKNGQWSVATTWSDPSARPSHNAALSGAVRIGGEQNHLAPSARRKSSTVENKDGGHVSPLTGT